MPRRHNQPHDDPFAALASDSSLTPTPKADHQGDEDDFPEPSPSRANVLAALNIADEETDLEMANYYVHRAIGEALLLLVDQNATDQRQRPGR
jgi:hypothetical protein